VIKIVGSHLPTDERRRFIGEMQAQETLSHPNIAQIFDAGQLDDGRPFMIIEYVGGQSLREMLVEQYGDQRLPKALPLEIVAEITEQACAGLREAHEKKIVHRDIKPENIIIKSDGDKYKIKIIDFGIAISQEGGVMPTRKTTAGVIGTPEYISPEQLLPTRYYLNKPGEKPGYSADIYALGVVIYEMLTGMRPFSGNSYELAMKHTKEIPIAPSKVRPDLNIPKAVDRVVLKSLSKQPGERQKSIELLAEELKAAINAPPEPEVTNLTLEVLKEETEFLIPKETEILPEFKNKQIASIFENPKYLWTLPVVLLSGLFIFLVYLKPWGGESENLPAPQSITGSPSVSPDPVLSRMTVSLTRRGKRGNEEAVSPDTTFYSGEGVKVSIQAEQNGYIYILLQGSSGKVFMLYPDPRIRGGNNQIAKGEMLSIPADNGWFQFDKNPGTENIYLVFAENRSDKLIGGLDVTMARGKISLPADLAKEATDLITLGGIIRGESRLVGLLKLRHLP
jgi:serine/threonine protein kinase